MTEWSPDIARLQARAEDEWLRVEREYCGRLFAYAQRRTGDLQASEDVVQETLLGAVRGIDDFDPSFTFEQYLFGICRNRTIDSLRRRKATTIQTGEDEQSFPGFETLARESETPSAIVRGRELSLRAGELLVQALREWVEETWREGEFLRLMVIEALFAGGWRNRDVWRRFQLRDETAVAGIKFRALKRLRELAAVRESGGDLLRFLESAEEVDHRLDLDLRSLWRERRISCPARYWLARLLAGNLAQGPADFVRFHLDEIGCTWCQANRDDLARVSHEEGFEALVGRLRDSTVRALASERRRP